SFKRFLQAMFNGPRRPRLIVRWDEIEKSVSAAASGTVADNTGVSQDMLKVLLTSMEDYGWMGCILVGGPGTGKTLASVCTGNTFGVRSLVGDLGATRASLVGESEQKIRLMLDIIFSIGGRGRALSGDRQRPRHAAGGVPAPLQPGHLVLRCAEPAGANGDRGDPAQPLRAAGPGTPRSQRLGRLRHSQLL